MYKDTTYYVGDGYCKKCGKPFVYVGDVPQTGWIKGQEPFCTCDQKKKESENLPRGWQCPICGQVNAPWVAVCPGWHGQTINGSNNTINL